MHRIDSATARPDVNGPGKPGFSDNSDLDNQDATYLTPAQMNAIQEELCGVVESLGGNLSKADNNQIAKLLLQTFSQKELVDPALESFVESLNTALGRIEDLESNALQTVKVGQIVTFAQHYSTATEVATFMGFGTWARFAQGRTLVGFSGVPADPEWARTSGAEYGEYEHQLTIDEMPEHGHVVTSGGVAAGVTGAGQGANHIEDNNGAGSRPGGTAQPTGGNQPHENVQPSVVVDCWIRTA